MTPTQKANLDQLHRIQGQLAGVELMSKKNAALLDIIQQLEAIRGNIKSYERKLLEQCCGKNLTPALQKTIGYLLKNVD